MIDDPALDLKRIIEVLKRPDSHCFIKTNKGNVYEIEAREFLSFAKVDILEDSERGKVNALSNAKRAIECRIDEFLTLSNFKRFALQERWNLKHKVEVLHSFGIPAPTVLKNLITARRNLLEHEYIRPKDWQEVQNAVDIAELFLGATDPYVQRGQIDSATIRVSGEARELVQKEFDLRGKKKGYWKHWIEDDEEYTVVFDSKNELVKLTNMSWQEDYASNRETGEIQSRETNNTREEKTNSLTIRDCKMEELRELMMLLREKGE